MTKFYHSQNSNGFQRPFTLYGCFSYLILVSGLLDIYNLVQIWQNKWQLKGDLFLYLCDPWLGSMFIMLRNALHLCHLSDVTVLLLSKSINLKSAL